jgi:chromosome segregation ATPase
LEGRVRNAIEPALREPNFDAVTAAVSAAVDKAGQDQQEVLNALHASLSKRFDARAKALAETIEHLGTSLESARKLGPVLERVGSRLDAQQPYLDQLREQLLQLGATMAGVPADVERRHTDTVASLERTAEALVGLRAHASDLDKAVQSMRAAQDQISKAVVDLRDGQTALPVRLEEIADGVVTGRRQLAEVTELARSMGVAVGHQQDQHEQQGAAANRLAELVAQSRAAARSDIERLESTLHLEILKQHQQDQARLTQAVAGVSEVVEREAGVLHQRVAALAAEVDGLRVELVARPDTSA